MSNPQDFLKYEFDLLRNAHKILEEDVLTSKQKAIALNKRCEELEGDCKVFHRGLNFVINLLKENIGETNLGIPVDENPFNEPFFKNVQRSTSKKPWNDEPRFQKHPSYKHNRKRDRSHSNENRNTYKAYDHVDKKRHVEMKYIRSKSKETIKRFSSEKKVHLEDVAKERRDRFLERHSTYEKKERQISPKFMENNCNIDKRNVFYNDTSGVKETKIKQKEDNLKSKQEPTLKCKSEVKECDSTQFTQRSKSSKGKATEITKSGESTEQIEHDAKPENKNDGDCVTAGTIEENQNIPIQTISVKQIDWNNVMVQIPEDTNILQDNPDTQPVEISIVDNSVYIDDNFEIFMENVQVIPNEPEKNTSIDKQSDVSDNLIIETSKDTDGSTAFEFVNVSEVGCNVELNSEPDKAVKNCDEEKSQSRKNDGHREKSTRHRKSHRKKSSKRDGKSPKKLPATSTRPNETKEQTDAELVSQIELKTVDLTKDCESTAVETQIVPEVTSVADVNTDTMLNIKTTPSKCTTTVVDNNTINITVRRRRSRIIKG